MSIIVIGKTNRGFVLASDTINYDVNTGMVGSVAVSKFTYLPALNLIISGVGSRALTDLFQIIALRKHPNSFDDVVREASQNFAQAYHEQLTNSPCSTEFELGGSVYLIGFSESRGDMEVHRVMDIGNDDYPAFEPHLIEDLVIMSGGPTLQQCESYGVTKELAKSGVDDPVTMVEVVTRAVCAGRQASRHLPDGNSRMREPFWWQAGGAIECACFQRHTIETWMRHRWPEDVPGEPIDPSRGVVGPPELFPVSEPQEGA